ncbi:MAG: hypothetical protein J7501_17795 [Bdellovibrio sp.]|nr:hypothetical protein [Bdellovibrio sp.]
MKLLFAFILLFSVYSSAQTPTYAECLSTVRARAGLTITSAEAMKMCADNPIEVVNCAVTQNQTYRFSGNLQQSLRQCRMEWSTTPFYNQAPSFAPGGASAGPAK